MRWNMAKQKTTKTTSTIQRLKDIVSGTNKTTKNNAKLTTNGAITKATGVRPTTKTANSTKPSVKIGEPLSNEAYAQKTIAQAKANYNAARANNDLLGMRVANVTANKARDIIGAEHENSSVGDKQYDTNRLTSTKTFKNANTTDSFKGLVEQPKKNTPHLPKNVVRGVERAVTPIPIVGSTLQTAKLGLPLIKNVPQMFDEENYEDKFKRGNIGGGIMSLAGETLMLPQTLLNNASNNLVSLANGKGLQPYQRKMDFGKFENSIADITGATPISEKLNAKRQGLGEAYKVGMDILTDPLNLLDVAEVQGIKALNKAGSSKYIKDLKTGKIADELSKIVSATTGKFVETIDDIGNLTKEDVEKVILALPSPKEQREVIGLLPESTRNTLLEKWKMGNRSGVLEALADESNIKRGKNIENDTINATSTQYMADNFGLNAPKYKNRSDIDVKSPKLATRRSEEALERLKNLKGNEAEIASQSLENDYNTIRSVYKTDYLTNDEIDRILKGDAKINTRYGVDIEGKLRALDEAIANDKRFNSLSAEEKFKLLDETGIGYQLLGDDFDEIAKGMTNRYSGNPTKDLPKMYSKPYLPKRNIEAPYKSTVEEAVPGARSSSTKLALRENPYAQFANDTVTGRGKISVDEPSLPKYEKKPSVGSTKPNKDTVNIGTKENPIHVEPPKPEQTARPIGKTVSDKDISKLSETARGIKGAFRKYKRNFVSGFEAGERFSKLQDLAGLKTNATSRAQAVRTSRSTINHIDRVALVDAMGNVRNDKSYMKVMGQVPEKDSKLFQEWAEMMHNIDRWATDTPVYKQISAEESAKRAEEILKQHPEFEGYMTDITKWWNDFTDAWLVDTGRVTKEAMQELREKYPHYIPTYREGKGVVNKDTTGRITGVGSAFKKAKGGESAVIPMEDSFLAQINNIVKGTRKNELYKNIVDSIIERPDVFGKFGKPLGNTSTDTLTKVDLDDLGQLITSADVENLSPIKDTTGAYLLKAYKDGKAQYVAINEELKKAIELLNNNYGSEELRFFHDIMNPVTNVRKTFITGINPIFGLANGIRDFSTYFIQTQASPLKALSSLGKSAMEIAKDGEHLKNYRALGGAEAGYYEQGKGLVDGTKKVVGLPLRAIEKFNGTIETLPRLAEYISLIEKYGDDYAGRLKALEGAADVTVNFSRNAPITKAADGWIMYLNAAVQGLDKFARQVKDKPLATLTKSGVLLSLPYAGLYVVNKDNPNYQNLSDHVKQNYFVLPNYWGEKDEEGNAKTFIKLPLNREYGAIMASSMDMLFSYMEEGIEGLESSAKSYRGTFANNFMPPTTEDSLPSTIKAIADNRNYYGGEIVPESMQKLSPENQTDVNTSKLADFIGQKTGLSRKTGLSPMQIDYALSQTGYPGQLLQSATSKQTATAGERLNNSLVKPFVNKFTADPRYQNGVISKFYDLKDKNSTVVADEKYEGMTDKSVAKRAQKEFNAISKDIGAITTLEKRVMGGETLTDEDKKVVSALGLSADQLKLLKSGKTSQKQKSELVNALRDIKNTIAQQGIDRINKGFNDYEVYIEDMSSANQKVYDAIKDKVSAKEYAETYGDWLKNNGSIADYLALAELGKNDTTLAMAKALNPSEKKWAKVQALERAGMTRAEYENFNKQIKDRGLTKLVDKRKYLTQVMLDYMAEDHTTAEVQAMRDKINAYEASLH